MSTSALSVAKWKRPGMATDEDVTAATACPNARPSPSGAWGRRRHQPRLQKHLDAPSNVVRRKLCVGVQTADDLA